MRHIALMTGTTAIGYMAIFIVDLIDIFFLGLLGEAEIVAAVGYAGTIIFFTTSLNMGTAIAAGALTSQAIGRGDQDEARRIATNALAFACGFAAVFSIIVWFSIPALLQLLGATGKTLDLAITYLRILVPGVVVLSMGMCGSNILRAKGDAKGAMYVTLLAGVVNLILDPIFIFGLNLGVAGAAWASLCAHITIFGVAIWATAYKHRMLGAFSWKAFKEDIPKIVHIAVPSIFTNVSTPFSNAYMVACFSAFGDSAVAGMAIISRIAPVTFALIFALSGAVGPVFGQNFGARMYDRIRQTLHNGMKFSAGVVITTCIALFLLQELFVQLFNATDEAADVIRFFCTYIAITFVFHGMLFVANTAFNNLGYPIYSTISNFLKAIVLTVPFVYLGAEWGGYKGVLVGHSIASALVGIASYWIAVRLVDKISRKDSAA